MRKLIIVESPNKVKTIKQFLSSDYIVMASIGHISEIVDKKDSYYNSGIYPDKNFKANYAVSKDKKEIVDKLKEQVELADIIYIASDPDREGEAIASSLKKFLKIPNDKCKRITFHEITKNAVLKALENPSAIDDNLSDAAHARQKLDKMLGYRLSPIARKTISAKSVGRCQSAGLKILVDREEEIQNFVPEKYADLFLHFNKNNTMFKAKYFGDNGKEIKRPSSNLCEQIVNDCGQNIKNNKWFKITNIINKDKISNPKPPFTTSTFQQEISSKLHIGVKDAMSYAQKLFEGIDINGQHIALITYIRTDSSEFAPEFIPVLEKYVKTNYGNTYYSPIRKQKKKETQQDGHEAIRPVDLEMTPEKLSKYIDNKSLLKVYDIIYKRTIATMMASSIISETTYIISNGKHDFHLVSNELKFDGYTKVYNYKDDKDGELIKETFNLNEDINKDYSPSLEIIEKQTTPPSRYKESTFIKELENTGIGRPSTFATIVSTLLDKSRNYCILEDDYIKPTEHGIKLSHFLNEAFPKLININYTSELEKELDLIANGKLSEIEFLRLFYESMENNIQESKTLVKSTKNKQELTDMICPQCGSKMYLRHGPFGDFYGCSKYPKCKGILKK